LPHRPDKIAFSSCAVPSVVQTFHREARPKIVLEIKAVSALDDEHRAQVHNYLKATGHRLGLLVNFGHYPKVQSERIIR